MNFNQKQSIGGKFFTPREIDVISCILNLRGIKNIAKILLISPRTVETHVQNIMFKLECNSQQSIIDFAETSKEFKEVKQHYFDLLIIATLQNKLYKISHSIRNTTINCQVNYFAKGYKIESLIKHLKLSGIKVTATIKKIKIHKDYSGYILYAICKDTINNLPVSEILATIPEIQNNIIILIMNGSSNIIPKSLNNLQVIDFSDNKKYCYSIFELLGLTLPIDLKNFVIEFKTQSNNIINSKTEIPPEILNSVLGNDGKSDKTISNDKENSLQQNNKIIVTLSSYKRIVTFSALIAIIIMILLIKFYLSSKHQSQDLNDFKSPLVISELNKFVTNNIEKKFSANNVEKEQIHINNSLIKQVEQILYYYHRQEVESYFANKASAVELVNYLHNLHALSNYYTHHYHDGKKAREILKYADNLVKHYVSNRSNTTINFNNLTTAELYTELSIVKDLPEIYTKIIYLLARTYIYQDDRTEAIKYFEISKHLGNRLNLFEGHLSDRQGLEIIRKDRIDQYIKKGNYKKAEQDLHQAIKVHKSFQKNTKKYKLDYKPQSKSSKTIILSKDVISQVQCGKQIAYFYTQSILITDNPEKQKSYLKEISCQFIGSKSFVGMLDQLDKISDKQAATVLNYLGNIFIELGNKSIELKEFRNKIVKKLNLNPGKNLEIIVQIFNLAKLKSRNIDFTKADAYNGLAKAYKQRIKQGNLTDRQKQGFLQKITEFKNKRDAVNKNLKRKQPSKVI